MKKFLSTVLACLTAGALFVGCGDAPSNDQKSEKGETKIGMIANLNVNEQKFNEHLKNLESNVKRNSIHLSSEHVYYDNLHALQMGLDSGAVNKISLYKCVGNYLVERQPELSILDEKISGTPLTDKFCCAVKSDNKELLDAINGAIKSMKDDGTLESLTKKYITELKDNEEPEAVELPKVDGYQTVKVAITGDLPPLDLIRADGTPAGFNTAVLAEIGNRINKNVELVSVDSAARASALSSGAVDIIFWVRVPDGGDMLPPDFDLPLGLLISEPYFSDQIVHVGKQK